MFRVGNPAAVISEFQGRLVLRFFFFCCCCPVFQSYFWRSEYAFDVGLCRDPERQWSDCTARVDAVRVVVDTARRVRVRR